MLVKDSLVGRDHECDMTRVHLGEKNNNNVQLLRACNSIISSTIFAAYSTESEEVTSKGLVFIKNMHLNRSWIWMK